MGNAFRAAHIAQKSAPISFNVRVGEKLEEQQAIHQQVVKRAEKEQEKVTPQTYCSPLCMILSTYYY